MKRKAAISVLIGSLLISGGVYAQESGASVNVSPDSELYETTRLMETAVYDLTDDKGEKALIQNEYADKRLAELEEMIDSGEEEELEQAIEDYEQHAEEAAANLEESDSELSDIEEKVSEKLAKRSENLRALLERDDLPDQAKAGIAKALENQERAMQNHINAKQKAEDAKAEKDDVEENYNEEESSEETEIDELQNDAVQSETESDDESDEVHVSKSNKPEGEPGARGQEQRNEAASKAAEHSPNGKGEEQRSEAASKGKEQSASNGNGKGNGNGNGNRP